MAGWSQPRVDPCRLAGRSGTWSPPSIISQNVNSLSTTSPGGIAGRFKKILTLLSFLLISHTIVCLQDIRIPSDSYISALRSTFPNHVFTATAHNTKVGGVVTVYPTSLREDYVVTNKVIDKGYILSTSFRHKWSDNNITIINTYLQASSDQGWDGQVSKLRKSNIRGNTVIIGDMNYAQDKRDRSGYHRDKPNYCVNNFKELLKKHDFEEIYQKFHTCYSSAEERLISSRIDLAFHNFTMDQLVNCYPKASVITTAPHTVSRHDHSSNVSDWKDIEHCDEIMDRQLVDKVITNDKGGDQVTDHLPLSIRFTNQVDKVKRKFASSALQSKNFKDSFKEIWYGNCTGEHWNTDLVDVGKSLCNASYLTKKKNP